LVEKTLAVGSRTHFTQTLPTIKRSEARKRVHSVDVAEISNAIVEKNFSAIDRSTGNTPGIHSFSTALDGLWTQTYSGNT
jgi:hypothetical protein